MMTHTQGDSISFDFSSPDYPLLSADWSGKWAIVAKPGVAAAKSGALTLSSDGAALALRIAPGITADVTPGRYLLVVRIENPIIGFREEIMREELTVIQSVILP